MELQMMNSSYKTYHLPVLKPHETQMSHLNSDIWNWNHEENGRSEADKVEGCRHYKTVMRKKKDRLHAHIWKQKEYQRCIETLQSHEKNKMPLGYVNTQMGQLVLKPGVGGSRIAFFSSTWTEATSKLHGPLQ
jgi:hypothetical protein